MPYKLFLLFFLSGCATSLPPSLIFLDNSHQQAVLIQAPRLDFWEKHNEQWRKVCFGLPCVVGRNGLALAGTKKEGDGKTPSGTFALQRSFGYMPSVNTGIEYHQVGSDDFWIDDPVSPEYNQWVKGPTRATSFEKLRRDDHLYKLGVVIEYNTHPVVPGAGSAIFMHIWRRYDHPTAGCVALSERNLRKVLRHLDKAKHPVIILGG